MKKKKILLWILLCLVPSIVFASSGSDELPIGVAIGIEAFVSIHMTIFVLIPIANIFGGDNAKNLLKRLFWGRIILLLLCDIFITPFIAIIDFISVFIGAFLIVPICSTIKKVGAYSGSASEVLSTPVRDAEIIQIGESVVLKCCACNEELTVSAKFCPNCGAVITGSNIKVEASTNESIKVTSKVAVLPTNYDSMYSLTEDKMLEEFLNRELTKQSITKNSKLIPYEVLKKKKIMNAILVFLTFVYISMIFFHFPLDTYAVGGVLLIIFYFICNSYNLMKYLKKEVKSRPSEKVSNIVMTVKSTFVKDNSRLPFLAGLCISIILPLIIFWNPRILYEKVDGGYAVRFYIFGVTNFKTATIPSTYKGKSVVSLRGNTFSNMYFLEEVSLPDTIVEIRGQAFKNDVSLTKVNIPSKLEYLGGGAFYNCKSITKIELPDTLTYLGGEAFYDASSLKSIKLSNQLPEIRGNTFENCTSLESIFIPDSVTRIGGHAFYGNSSLKRVYLTPNSKLTEIGSSAFRRCDSLRNIGLPGNVSVNERAFKESPTNIYIFKTLKAYPTGYSVIETSNYGTVEFTIKKQQVLNGKLYVDIVIAGGIEEELQLRCDGTTTFIREDFYITTMDYDEHPYRVFEIYVTYY